jgi:hypothetical protein
MLQGAPIMQSGPFLPFTDFCFPICKMRTLGIVISDTLESGFFPAPVSGVGQHHWDDSSARREVADCTPAV